MIFLFKIGFLAINWLDIIDVLLVGLLLYQLYQLMRGSIAIKVFLGILSLYLLYLVVKASQMELLTSILGQFMGVGVLSTIILFQQEIRKFLIIIGKSTSFKSKDSFFSFFSFFTHWKKHNFEDTSVSLVVDALKVMSKNHTGALLVFSKDSELKFFADSGDIIDAKISSRLILSIFNKYSPLHDGAVIIHKNRILAARCVLPVSENNTLPAHFGLRHRSAVGMSEVTDSLIVTVSEETGKISIVEHGSFSKNLTNSEIEDRINKYLSDTIDGAELRNEKETSISETS